MNEPHPNPPATAPAKSGKGRLVWNAIKGLAKVGFAYMALMMMDRIIMNLNSIESTANSTQKMFGDLHKALIPSEEPQAAPPAAPAAVENTRAGGGAGNMFSIGIPGSLPSYHGQ